MRAVRYALTYRLLLAVLFSIVPFAGCAALSSIQQTEHGQGGTWVQGPTNAESQTARPEQNGSVERNPRIRTVELNPIADMEAPVLDEPAALAAAPPPGLQSSCPAFVSLCRTGFYSLFFFQSFRSQDVLH